MKIYKVFPCMQLISISDILYIFFNVTLFLFQYIFRYTIYSNFKTVRSTIYESNFISENYYSHVLCLLKNKIASEMPVPQSLGK